MFAYLVNFFYLWYRIDHFT